MAEEQKKKAKPSMNAFIYGIPVGKGNSRFVGRKKKYKIRGMKKK